MVIVNEINFVQLSIHVYMLKQSDYISIFFFFELIAGSSDDSSSLVQPDYDPSTTPIAVDSALLAPSPDYYVFTDQVLRDYEYWEGVD